MVAGSHEEKGHYQSPERRGHAKRERIEDDGYVRESEMRIGDMCSFAS